VFSAGRRQVPPSTDTLCTSSQPVSAIQSLQQVTAKVSEGSDHISINICLFSFIGTRPIKKRAMITKSKFMNIHLHLLQYPFPRGCQNSLLWTRSLSHGNESHDFQATLSAISPVCSGSRSKQLNLSAPQFLCETCPYHLLTLQRLRALNACQVS